MSIYFILCGPYYKDRSGHENAYYHHDVLTLEGMTDLVAFCRLVTRPGAQAHMFGFTLQFGQWCRMILGARVKKEGDGDEGDVCVTSFGELNRMAIFQGGGVLLYYT